MEQHCKHLFEKFGEVCRQHADRVVLKVSDGKELHPVTFRKLHADVDAWARYMQEKGIQAGDRVAAIAAKCDNHFRFFYACWKLGAIAVPVCETLGNDEMSFVLKDCSPKLVLSSETYLKKARETAGEIPVEAWEKLPLATE